uniref:fibronectin type III domain-containing protein n=1 Tax=Nocardioides gilvus TaxID=1735589 RepID=UPI0013A58EF4
GVKTVAGDATSVEFPDLDRGKAYSFTLIATNAVGNSAPSPASDAITVPFHTRPPAPTSVTATRADKAATVTWRQPSSSDPITNYTVIATPGGKSVTVSGTTTSARIAGLVNGSPYQFAVIASSGTEASDRSALSNAVTPAGRPTRVSKPTLKLSKAERKVTIRWRAASPNGAPVTRYVVTSNKARSKTATATRRSVVFTKLKPGTYTFRVVAVNAAGNSLPSEVVKVRIKR